MWDREKPSIKLGRTRFCSLKPRNVRLVTSAHLESVCALTVQMYATSAMHWTSPSLEQIYLQPQRLQIREHSWMSSYVSYVLEQRVPFPQGRMSKWTTEGTRFHKSECLNGQCTECSNTEHQIMTYYSQLCDSGVSVVWNTWERKTDRLARMVTSVASWRPRKAVSSFACENWSRQIWRSQCKTPPLYSIFSLHTGNITSTGVARRCSSLAMSCWSLFGKNQRVSYQDEIKGAYFNSAQMTIHSVVAL